MISVNDLLVLEPPAAQRVSVAVYCILVLLVFWTAVVALVIYHACIVAFCLVAVFCLTA